MDYRDIYETSADAYQELVAAEDVDGNLALVLTEVLGSVGAEAPRNIDRLRVLEVGAGTGRVTRLLRTAGAQVIATEPAAAMIGVAATLSADDPGVDFCRAEAARLPTADKVFDAAVAGWVFAHQREWSPHTWRDVVSQFIEECERVTTSGAPIILIETLGTGFEEPNPPADLLEYYRWLEGPMAFTSRWIRTDYQFPTVEQAARVAGSFFGDGFAATVREHGWVRIPECTGIWVRP